ncbi:hypothetical protein PFTANZ_02724 [Plasmodium falciparum Tanzania (2000708)]|uniref:Surface antigen n=1 Tax=Plasmodium falciparum Tanzania (2000708) TaxID=1036725 RepID=A0A024W6M6_PLAFA|nr:hypothetical protein PFTANZ_02724 [Plasmodium falciparum Tanzania (2000708)]
MKEVMQDFDRQTSERFKQYDERMIKNRQKCKEQCDREMQKIILKDKIEKELTEKLSTLQTDISTDDIPTCVCEQSLADKTEKLCLKCGYGLGSNIPLVGLISGIGFYSGVLEYAVDFGISEGARVAASKTVKMITTLLEQNYNGLKDLLKGSLDVIVITHTNSPMKLGNAVYTAVDNTCTALSYGTVGPPSICKSPIVDLQNFYQTVPHVLVEASKAGKAAGFVAAEDAKLKAWNAAFTWEIFFSSSLGISIIVTVCIVYSLILFLFFRKIIKITIIIYGIYKLTNKEQL